MADPKPATHVAIPVDIYKSFIDSIKSEKGLTPEALAKLIISAEGIVATKNEPEFVETTAE